MEQYFIEFYGFLQKHGWPGALRLLSAMMIISVLSVAIFYYFWIYRPLLRMCMPPPHFSFVKEIIKVLLLTALIVWIYQL
ncbi:MAG: hypothetical protein WCL37_07400 [Chrysiogenales bacterium]